MVRNLSGVKAPTLSAMPYHGYMEPPKKLCECGCGEATSIAPRNDWTRGIVKGQPMRFKRGHSARSHLYPPGENPQARGGQKRRKLHAELGQRFGRGIVIEIDLMIPRRGRPITQGLRGARLLCDCGNEYVSALQALCSGACQSCGCLHLERVSGKRVGRGMAHTRPHGRPIKNVPHGDAPLCRCGCGELTAWNRRKNRWNVYVTDHNRKPAPYKDEAWLREEYMVKRRTIEEMASDFGIHPSAIKRWMDKLGIPRRDKSEARMGRKVGPLNPAWKGGVAQWEYSSDWKVLARQIRDRDKWTCQDCGDRRKYWGGALHVHHIDENKFNNDPANLISLCDKCHRERHRLLAKAKKAAA